MNRKVAALALASLLIYGWSNAYQQDIDLTPMNVVRIYDGDTITVNLPGQHDLFGKEIGVRIAGIDTPELVSRCSTSEERAMEKQKGLEAKAYVQNMLASGKVITLTSLERDKYFRILAEVLVDNRSVGASLIEAGLADPYDGGTKTGWCGR